MEDLIEHGKQVLHAGFCPACDVGGNAQELQREQPEGFHYHGRQDGEDPPYMFCPVDGQGYRLVNDEMRILPPCNGGVHADGTVGYR